MQKNKKLLKLKSVKKNSELQKILFLCKTKKQPYELMRLNIKYNYIYLLVKLKELRDLNLLVKEKYGYKSYYTTSPQGLEILKDEQVVVTKIK